MSFTWGGNVSTIAGSIRGFKDGNTNDSLFYDPWDITISHDGTLYVADSGNHRIRKISANRIVSTVAGSTQGFKDGNTNDSLFSFPISITITYDGTLYVADTANHRIRKISTNGIVSTVAGSRRGFKDGNTNDSLFNDPRGITISQDGTLYVTDYFNHRIRKISTNGIVSTVAGSIQGFKDGNANDSLFNYPGGITISHDGTLYVADNNNHRIRKISTNGIVSTVAGSIQGFKDGNTNDSSFYYPCGITISHNGTLYVSDTSNDRIRKISPNIQFFPMKILLNDNNYSDMVL